jgi:hypothetical protein
VAAWCAVDGNPSRVFVLLGGDGGVRVECVQIDGLRGGGGACKVRVRLLVCAEMCSCVCSIAIAQLFQEDTASLNAGDVIPAVSEGDVIGSQCAGRGRSAPRISP